VDLGVHGCQEQLDVSEVVAAKDRVNVGVLGDGDGSGLMVALHLDAEHLVQFTKVGDLNVVA
jgi:hypothetical protein